MTVLFLLAIDEEPANSELELNKNFALEFVFTINIVASERGDYVKES